MKLNFLHILLMCVSIIFSAGYYWDKASAYDGRITSLEDTTKAIPVMKARIDDIWLAMGLDRKKE